jgi:hypothetical protein
MKTQQKRFMMKKLDRRLNIGLLALMALGVAPLASANIPERTTLITIINEYRVAQKELVQERLELAESLRDRTAEERQRAVQEYQTTNAERLALHRARAEQVRELMAGVRPDVDRPDRALGPGGLAVVDRPEVPLPMQDLMAAFRATRNALLQERLALLADMREATDEERARALEDLRRNNAETAAQQRALAHEIRDAVQDVREERRSK